MQTIALPDGRTTSRISFGCGSLVGGAGRRRSWRLIETARELGIAHFDVAPSYGFGLAENVLGDVIGGDSTVTVTTKVGIARPGNGSLKAALRKWARPLLNLHPGLKTQLATRTGGVRNSMMLTPAVVRESLSDSLRRLRRDRADIFLLHEPPAGTPSDDVAEAMKKLAVQGVVGSVGSGTGGEIALLPPFGRVRQYRWDRGSSPSMDDASFHIVHGLLRARLKRGGDLSHAQCREPFDHPTQPAALVSLALAQEPGRMVIVSTSDPDRLKSLIGGIDWSPRSG